MAPFTCRLKNAVSSIRSAGMAAGFSAVRKSLQPATVAGIPIAAASASARTRGWSAGRFVIGVGTGSEGHVDGEGHPPGLRHRVRIRTNERRRVRALLVRAVAADLWVQTGIVGPGSEVPPRERQGEPVDAGPL